MTEYHVPFKFVDSEETREALAKSIAGHEDIIMVNPEPARIIGKKKNMMPSPTPEQQHDPLFEAIWQTIKSWDVNVPEYYEGYCGANGSHVLLILEAVKDVLER